MYVDQFGTNKTVDVVGYGWMDRKVKSKPAWEWNSFRFDGVTRLDLYNFDDEPTQRLDNFVIKQNGCSKYSNGPWVA